MNEKIEDKQSSEELLDVERPRRIRSFVRRTGRMTSGQQKAYEDNMARFGCDPAEPFVAVEKFGRDAPLYLEIGFGMGDSLAIMAMADSSVDFVGIEVHTPGVGRLLQMLDENNLNNVRVYEADAVEVLNRCFADASLDRVQIYFPDPWHKKRHHKRRLVNDGFLDLLAARLKKGGCLHVATDWKPYAEHVLEVMQERQDFVNQSEQADGCVPRPHWRPETKFERRGLKLGHEVSDLLFIRQ